jgi:hypothetical protein
MSNSRLLAVILALLVSTFGREPAAVAETKPDDAKAAPASPDVAATPPEIEFFLARGEAGACGPGCSEWIAAEGRIDGGAAQRLRRLLTKLARRWPPIYFHSPGGSVAGSIELGRLMRDQKLEASVGHTIPLGCDRDKQLEKSCEALKRSGQELESEFDPTIAMCNSACVYALAGGAVRLVPPWVKLGIHDVGFESDQAPPRGAVLGEAKRLVHARIQEYLHDMGIDEALYRAAAAIPFESKKFLEREELVRFGIDRREFGETGWQLLDKPMPTIIKRFFVPTDGDQTRYLDDFVSLDCGSDRAIRLALGRQRSSSETLGTAQRSTSINVNGQRVDLPQQIASKGFYMRSATLTVSTFDALDDNATLGLPAGDPAGSGESAGGLTLNMQGFAEAYAKLRRQCDERTRNAIAAALTAKQIPYLSPASPALQYRWAAQPWTEFPNPPAAAPVARSTAAQSVSNAEPPSRSEPVRQGCHLEIAAEPQHVRGRVTGFLSGDEALIRTRRIEAQLGAKVSPDYFSLTRVTVEIDPADKESSDRTTMAAIPEAMAVKIGDLVELDGRHRDQSLPCHFIPWTINRLIEHVE